MMSSGSNVRDVGRSIGSSEVIPISWVRDALWRGRTAVIQDHRIQMTGNVTVLHYSITSNMLMLEAVEPIVVYTGSSSVHGYC